MLTGNKHPYLEGVHLSHDEKLATILEILKDKQEITLDKSIKHPLAIKILRGCLAIDVEKRMNIEEIIKCFEEDGKYKNEDTKKEDSKKEDSKKEDSKKEDTKKKKKNHKKKSPKKEETTKADSEEKKETNVQKNFCFSWKDVSWKLVKTLKGHQKMVLSLQFSQCEGENNKTRLVSGSEDCKVMIWEDINSVESKKKILEGHSKSVSCVRFSNKGELVASCANDNQIKFWDTSTGKPIQSFKAHDGYFFDFLIGGPLRALLFSCDGNYLINGSGSNIQVRDSKIGTLIREFDHKHTNTVRCLCQSPDGTLLASGSYDCSVKLWDFNKGKLIKTLEPIHSGYVFSICFSHNWKLIASGSRDTSIKLWDTFTHQLVKTLKGHTNDVRVVCFSPDDHSLASGSFDASIKFWDVESGVVLQDLDEKVVESDVRSLCFTPDGRKMASGHWNKLIKIWKC